MSDFPTIEVSGVIRLGQFLKLANLAEDGDSHASSSRVATYTSTTQLKPGEVVSSQTVTS